MPAEEEQQQPVSFSFKTGELSKLVHASPILHIRLGIDPERAESKDDKFRLYSADGKYDKTLTIKDDKVDGDDFVDLVYENLKVSQKYTLEIDPGAQGDKYNLFEEVPYRELIDFYSELEPGDELEEVEDEEEDSDSQEETSEPDWEDEENGNSEYGGDADDDDTQMEQILESEKPDEDDEIDWDSIEPGRTPTQSQSEDDSDDDDEDAELPDMDDWDKG